jgi:hypothetical protein
LLRKSANRDEVAAILAAPNRLGVAAEGDPAERSMAG